MCMLEFPDSTGRNHQGIENQLIELPEFLPKVGRIRCQRQLGGMLNYYY